MPIQFDSSGSPMVQIFVEDYYSVSLGYNVFLNSPISSLKAAIEEAEGEPVAQQCLKFRGQELENNKTISSYNISVGSVVQLRKMPSLIYVKMLTGECIPCDVDFNVDTGLSLKLILEEKKHIPVDQQCFIFKGMQLQDHRTLESYNIYNEATLHLILRLRGGGSNALAYAMACCSWDGDMKHYGTKGRSLLPRMIVVITEKRDKNWYRAREPDDYTGKSEGVLPCRFVQILKYLNDAFERLDLDPSPESRFFPFTAGTNLDGSETSQIANLELPRQVPNIPTIPLPIFQFPWAEPRKFSRGFADKGHSLLEITITYSRDAVPHEPTLLDVTLICRAIKSRVSEVSLQVVVPNGEVGDVQCPSATTLGYESEMQIKFTKHNELTLGGEAGVSNAMLTGNVMRMTEEERSGTLPTRMLITGDVLRGNTASWWLKEASTPNGGTGVPARLSDMSFTLTRQPEAFEFDCLVVVGGGKKYHLKSSSRIPSLFRGLLTR